MTHDLTEPARLLTSADDPLLKNLLRAGEAELAGSDQLAAVAAKLGPILSGGGGGGGGSGGAGPAGLGAVKVAGALTGTAKLLGALGIGVMVAGTGGYLALRSPDNVPSSVASRSANSSAHATPASAAVMEKGAPPLATSDPRVDLNAPLLTAAPSSPRPALRAPAPARAESPVATAFAPIEAPEPEVRMLQRAQDALGDPSRSLAICEEHARRYPAGLLSQEREVIAIDALSRLGRTDAARDRARRFRTANPRSSHLGRIEVLVGKDF